MAKKAPQSVQSDFFASALLVFAVAGLVVSSTAAAAGVGKLAYDFQINLPQSSVSAQVASVASANGTGLTDAQISAVLSLLSAFGAPQDTVTSVSAILRGVNSDGSEPSNPATAPATPSTSSGQAGSGQTGATVVATTTAGHPTVPLFCPNITRHLNRGVMGDDVTGLQKFLSQQGALTDDNVTGFFGPATQAALQQWQLASGIVSTTDSDSGAGEVGTLTRDAIERLCDVPHSVTIHDCPGGYSWHNDQCVANATTTLPTHVPPTPGWVGSTTPPARTPGSSGAGSPNGWFGR